jgi:hypothetical protein
MPRALDELGWCTGMLGRRRAVLERRVLCKGRTTVVQLRGRAVLGCGTLFETSKEGGARVCDGDGVLLAAEKPRNGDCGYEAVHGVMCEVLSYGYSREMFPVSPMGTISASELPY